MVKHLLHVICLFEKLAVAQEIAKGEGMQLFFPDDFQDTPASVGHFISAALIIGCFRMRHAIVRNADGVSHLVCRDFVMREVSPVIMADSAVRAGLGHAQQTRNSHGCANNLAGPIPHAVKLLRQLPLHLDGEGQAFLLGFFREDDVLRLTEFRFQKTEYCTGTWR